MAKIEIDGKAIDSQWLGPSASEAPTIVLLHEGLGSIALWKDFPERLVRATGCGVLSYSRWGHGASSPLAEPRTLAYLHEEASEALSSVIEHFAIPSPPILMGHSDGASISLIYAGSTDRPVAGLVLEAPHVFVEDITSKGIKEAASVYRTTDLRDKLARYHDDPDGVFRTWNETWLDPTFRSWNIEEVLPGINCPILLIQGEDDQYATLAQIEAIARQVSGPVETLVLPGCGHAPHDEQPEGVLVAVARIVTEVRPEG